MILRALTYNIRGGRGVDGRRDCARIGALLEDKRLDIVLLQEVDARARGNEVLAELQGGRFPHALTAPTLTTETGWYGNAILSRFPVREAKVIDISVTGREPRNILDAILETPAGPLHVVNTHKGLGALERAAQLGRLNDLLSTDCEIPLLVGGDFNQWAFSARAFRKLNGRLQPMKTAASFPTSLPFLQLDRFWCRPRGLIRNARVLKTPETKRYSDHFPLWADLELPAARPGDGSA